MAHFLDIQTIIEKGYVTDVALAAGLVKGDFDVEDEIIKKHIHQIGAYDAVYTTAPSVEDDPSTVNVDESTFTGETLENYVTSQMEAKDILVVKDTDGDSTNDIVFYLGSKTDGITKTWSGSPTAKVATVLKKLNISRSNYSVPSSYTIAKDLDGVVLTDAPT